MFKLTRLEREGGAASFGGIWCVAIFATEGRENGPSGLFGEPKLVWDSLEANTFREGVSVRVSEELPTVRKPTGYPNPILQADRLREITETNPDRSIKELAALFGKRLNWVWGMIRIGRLPLRITDYVRGLGPYVNRSAVTTIDLLRIAGLPVQAQLLRFDELLKRRKCLNTC
jgi:hypothetical protein